MHGLCVSSQQPAVTTSRPSSRRKGSGALCENLADAAEITSEILDRTLLAVWERYFTECERKVVWKEENIPDTRSDLHVNRSLLSAAQALQCFCGL